MVETVRISEAALEELLAGYDVWRRGHGKLLIRRVDALLCMQPPSAR